VVSVIGSKNGMLFFFSKYAGGVSKK